MRICLPTAGKRGLAENVWNHFGSAACFTVYDTESEELQILENDNQHHEHGNCHPLAAIAALDVQAILTGGMGHRAVMALNEGGIRVYLLAGGTVAEAIRKFASGQLTELTLENACGGHSCH